MKPPEQFLQKFVRCLAALWVVGLAFQHIHAQPIQFAFTNLVGAPGGRGNVDGVGTAARFDSPEGIAIDSSGNVYTSDRNNHTIRKITPSGMVTTLAGSAGLFGSTGGTGSAARFNEPRDAAVDSVGNVYVADYGNQTIRKVTPGGVVTTLAGSAGRFGSADGTGSAARFYYPQGVAVDSVGSVYVADTFNRTIRKVSASGVVSTLAGSARQAGSADGTGNAARFAYPTKLALDSAGNVYVADYFDSTIRKVTPSGDVTTLAGSANAVGSADGRSEAARFNGPLGVAVDSADNVYVGDTFNRTIRKITPDGDVTTLAGSPGQSGSADGTGNAARFYGPEGIAVDRAGNLYVADYFNYTIRKVTPGGTVSTLAGSAEQSGKADGTGSAARFRVPASVAVDSAGNVFVADYFNHTIRKVAVDGNVTTLAGSPGQSGSADGSGTAARFFQPAGVAVDSVGNLYVADYGNHTIRKVTLDGDVATLAGTAGQWGSADGKGSVARFFGPAGVTVDNASNVYVADQINSTIRKVSPEGVVTTLAGIALEDGSTDGSGTAARFYSPGGVAVDSTGNLYVADYRNDTIRKITSGGFVTTLAGSVERIGSVDAKGSAARFSYPAGVAVDSADNVYVADYSNHTIRKVTPDGMVTTIAGTPGGASGRDGIGPDAQFSYPQGVAVDSAGNLYVADSGNNRISKGVPIISAPRFIDLQINNGFWNATLSGLWPGATVILQSSINLRDWTAIQTNPASGTSVSVTRPIDPQTQAEFVRAMVK